MAYIFKRTENSEDRSITASVAIGSDHAGLGLKEKIKAHLQDQGVVVVDHGTMSEGSCDYPDFARSVGEAVSRGDATFGILVCSTGIGMSITANKIHGIRASLVHTVFEAEMTRRHNNANIICLGANVIGAPIALDAVDVFLRTDFEGGRHLRRVEKMMQAES